MLNDNGAITVVEFLDYACGVCKRVSELRQPGESDLVTVTAYDDSGDSATASMVVRWE